MFTAAIQNMLVNIEYFYLETFKDNVFTLNQNKFRAIYICGVCKENKL